MITRMIIVYPMGYTCQGGQSEKKGARRPPKSGVLGDYLDRSSLSPPLSGGNTTRRPSTGNALSSIEKPVPSLCGNAAPILVQRFWVLPSRSYSSTLKTLRWVGVSAGAGEGIGIRAWVG